MMPGSGTTRTSGSPRWPWQRWWWWWWCVWWWSCCSDVGVVAQGDCKDGEDVAVAVVVSVFVTLVVVAVVLVIVYIVLRRRHGGFLFPPKPTRKSLVHSEDPGNRIPHRDSCYDNPAFLARDTIDLEEGVDSASPKRNSTSVGKQDLPYNIRSSSLSATGEPDGPRRRGSGGSLDKYSGPETVSVWLQSQDIIGLGFNISGNMRDGIYVSQVHSRGPAIDSGKVQVGDRVRQVTVVYDNMVYEDALTILSYASPYPVQVVLQKERLPGADPNSRSSEQLNHPLYRSQSLDALPRSPGEFHCFKPKRWQSQLKSETRTDSPKKGEGERRSRALDREGSPSGWETFGARSDVMVHAAETPDGSPSMAGYKAARKAADPTDTPDGSPSLARYQAARDITPPVKSQDVKVTSSFMPPAEDSPVRDRRKEVKLYPETDHDLASLMDQMLDKETEDGVFSPRTASAVSGSPKTPPSKPERKKRTSSASFISQDSSLELGTADVAVEDICVAVETAQVHSLPPGMQDLGGQEVEEEEIQPTHVKREITIGAEGFEFTPIEKPEPQEETEERPRSLNLFDYVQRPSRPPSPEGDPVEEDLIEAAVASRDIQAAPPSHSAKAQNSKSYDQAKSARQRQGTPRLNDEAIEGLVLTDLPESASRGLGGTDFGQYLEDTRQGFLHKRETQQPARDTTSGISGDLTDLPGTKDTGPSPAVRSSHSDNQLQRRSGNTTDNRRRGEDGLEWSGQRLVRSGVFSEIAHDDSVSDWTDRYTFNDDDDDNSVTSDKRSAADTTYAESDPELNPPRILPSKDFSKGRENLSNLSDLSNSLSSSRSSSPALTRNGPVGEGGTGRHLPATNNLAGGRSAAIELTPTSDNNANSKPITFVLNASAADDDLDC